MLHLEKNKIILVEGGGEIYLDQCDQKINYLFAMLKDKTIPFEERQKIAHSVLTKYLNLKAQSGRCIVLLCMIDIFSNNGYSSFYILMRNLIKSIKKKNFQGNGSIYS